MSIDRWIALLSSIGGLAAALVALASLFEMRRQRRNQNLAALFIPACGWTCRFKVTDAASEVPAGFATSKAQVEQSRQSIELVNAGRSPALSVEARCSYRHSEIIALLSSYRDERQLKVKVGKNFVSYTTSRTQCMLRPEYDGYSKIDFILPSGESGVGRALMALPQGYLILLEEYVHLLSDTLRSPSERDTDLLDVDPKLLFSLTITVSHRDVEGQRHESKFKFEPTIVMMTDENAEGYSTVIKTG